MNFNDIATARDAADMAAVRRRWPDLAAAGDARTRETAQAQHKALLPELVAAELAMRASAAAVDQRKNGSFGQVERDRAAAAYAAAVTHHDTLLLKVEQAHETAFPSKPGAAS